MREFWAMSDAVLVTAALALATIGIRLLGIAVGQNLPQQGIWANVLKSLPGCLIVSLIAVMLLAKGPLEWAAAAVALFVAIATRSLPLTMVIGILTIWLLRNSGIGI